jgi:hypothetical protein
MSDGLATAKQLITDTMIDLVEDALFVDRPLRPSARRRVEQANEEVVRTLRLAALNDDELLDPARVQAICNAVARRHSVKPRHMFGLQQLGAEIVDDVTVTEESAALAARVARIERDLTTPEAAGSVFLRDEAPQPTSTPAQLVAFREASPEARGADAHQTLAFAYLVFALMAIVLLVADLVQPDASWPVTVALPALFVLLVAAARAALGASIDRRREALAAGG